MPLAAQQSAMASAIEAANSSMGESGDSGHAGEAWAGVAEAYFSGGLNPAWTPIGLEAGKAAFASAFGSSVVADPAGATLAVALQNGFQAFAALAAVPANAAPGLPAQLVPIVPPPAPPVIVTITSPAAETASALAAELLGKLSPWALTGLVSVTTPGGPVPTTPWS